MITTVLSWYDSIEKSYSKNTYGLNKNTYSIINKILEYKVFVRKIARTVILGYICLVFLFKF